MNNERIKELSKQAWAWAEQQEYKDATQEFSDILEQKFAELIVRECADISNQAEKQCQHPGTMMKNHFGVE
jgi:predicted component of type VI protein secretion system